MSKLENLIKPFPLSEITAPCNGAVVYLDYYWLTKDGSAFKSNMSGALQCNPNKGVVERVYGELLTSGYEITHIPVAFVVKGHRHD